LLLVLVSHPSVVFPLQSPKPALQRAPQVPIAQVGVAFAPAAQARPQLPQWATVARRSASQPLLATPSQLPKPVAH
jgi:hypothetical protein